MSLSLHFLKDSFAGYQILGVQSSNFCTLKYYPIIFWHPCLFLYIIRYILAAFLSFCLPLNFVSLTMMHLGIKLFRFILLGVMKFKCRFTSLIKFEKFLAIISSNLVQSLSSTINKIFK